MPEPKAAEASTTRAIWSGTITFGLVSIPVELYSAIKPRRTSMRMVDTKGRPLGRQYYCPKEGKALEADEIVRGYPMEDGKMVVVTDEELASIAPDMSRDIELRRFVPIEQIPPSYYQRPYLLAPAGRSTKAYHLLAETMQRTGRVGIGTFVMRGHEYMVAIISDGGLLRAETLRFADELRSADDVGLPKASKPSAKRVKEFTQAIADLTRDSLDMNELSDRYAEAIHEVVEAKEKKGKDVVETSAATDEDGGEEGAEIVDLLQVLRQRLSTKAQVETAAEPPRASAAASGDLADMSRQALYEEAQRLGIPGRSRMGKTELIKAIRKAA